MKPYAITGSQEVKPEILNATQPIADSRRPLNQPFDVINVPGALLRLQTLAAISGQSIATLYRAAGRGQLALVKKGLRCTRVTSESARAYLELLANGEA